MLPIFLLEEMLVRFKVIFVLNFRLNPLITPPLEKSPLMTLSLQEVIIVGSCSEQVSVSSFQFSAFSIQFTVLGNSKNV
jgi:hypothetical protein